MFDIAAHSFDLPESFIQKYIGKQPNFGPLGLFTFKRTYARIIKDENRNEEYWETVRRVVEGTFSIQKNHCKRNHLPWDERKAQRTAKRMFELMWDFKFLPPGRGLWAMGTDYVQQRGGAALNNCGFVSTVNIDKDAIKPFLFIMDMSMVGVGVGFDTTGANKCEVVSPNGMVEVIVQDSREGWVNALQVLLEAYTCGGPLPIYNVELVRPAGQPINGFGGTASGPEPLLEMLHDIRAIFEARLGDKLTSADIVDIGNLIGRCVVAGNVRRSAEIVFGDPDDVEFALLKQDKDKLIHHRWASNNSIFAKIGMDYKWHAKQTAVNGEPGYMWLDNARAFGRMKDPADWKDKDAVGGNPCLTADTWIHTTNGARQIKDLVGSQHTLIVDGQTHETDWRGFYPTGHRSVYRITLENGMSIRATANHKFMTRNGWKEVGKMLSSNEELVFSDNRKPISWGDNTPRDYAIGYLLGHLAGDGTITPDMAVLSVWDKDGNTGNLQELILRYILQAGLEHRSDWQGWLHIDDRGESRLHSAALRDLASQYSMTQGDKITSSLDIIERQSEAFLSSYIRGLFDTDGSVQGDQNKGLSVRLSNTNLKLLQMVQRVLLRCGIVSTIYTDRQPAGERIMPDGNGGHNSYLCLAVHELVISCDSILRFKCHVGFHHDDKRNKLHDLVDCYKRTPNASKFYSAIQSIVEDGYEDVYDCTVPGKHCFDANGFVAHNCLEQTLHNYELCTLVETFPSRHNNLDEYLETLKIAYLYAKTVTLVPTHWSETNAVMAQNRRIGLSQSGIIKAFGRHGRREMLRWCDKGYEFINGLDIQYSNWLGVSRSIKKTSVKPSGTISLLPGEPPGIHYPHSEYYIRRIRVGKHSNLWRLAESAGYHVEPAVGQEDSTMVVSFPVKEEFFVRSKDNVSIWEQVANAVAYQRLWADNQVSITVTFQASEKDDIEHTLELYEGELKGISFLPLEEHGYIQAPYETITEQQYLSMTKDIKPIEMNSTSEQGIVPKFCDGDTCTI